MNKHWRNKGINMFILISPLLIISLILLILFHKSKVNSSYYGKVFSKSIRSNHTYVVLALEGIDEEFKFDNSDFFQDDLVVGEYIEVNCDSNGECKPVFLNQSKRVEMVIE